VNPDESEVLTLPFLAILGWGLVIVTVTGLYNVCGNGEFDSGSDGSELRG
jgi:hypothetical protein